MKHSLKNPFCETSHRAPEAHRNAYFGPLIIHQDVWNRVGDVRDAFDAGGIEIIFGAPRNAASRTEGQAMRVVQAIGQPSAPIAPDIRA